jgi:DNA repair ATPase RecN
MDGLSAASGAFVVVSLALQIADGIKKLCEFWESIQEAPKTIRFIAKDLNTISEIVEDIRQEANNATPYTHAFSASLAAMDQCSDRLDTLRGLLEELKLGFSSTSRRIRKKSALKARGKYNVQERTIV